MGEPHHNVKRRRLPSWMSSSTSIINDSDKQKEDSPSKSCSLVEDDEAPVPVEKRRKQQQVGGRTTARPIPAPKNPKARRKRRRRRHHSASDDDDDDVEEDDADFQQQEGEELTVDDLITIAKEESNMWRTQWEKKKTCEMEEMKNLMKYVKADEAKSSKQHGVTIEPNSRNTLSSTPIKEKPQEPDSGEQIETTSLTSRNNSGDSVFGIEVLPTVTSLGPSSNSDKIKDGEHPPTEEIIYTSSKTGDPAQDMLDLFLGPLLNKAKIESMKHETVREEFTLNYGLDKPSQKEEIGEQLPPLTKKKSSLRDKVAMFLD